MADSKKGPTPARTDVCAACGKVMDGSVRVGGLDYCNMDCATGMVDGKRDYDKVTERVLRELVHMQTSDNPHDDWYTLVGVMREKCKKVAADMDISKSCVESYDTESLLSVDARRDLTSTRLAELVAYATMLLHYDDKSWWKAHRA
jgi:hypothetical protein